MILLDHRPFEIMLLCLLGVGAGVGGFRFVRGRRKLVRLPARVCCILLTGASGLVLTIFGFIQATSVNKVAATVYSPDRTRAIVVRQWDMGIGGGGTYLNLYSYGGLLEKTIAAGEWIDAVGIRWTSNSEVELRAAPYRLPFCASTASLRVTCAGAEPDHPDVR